jgi:hypothetical protein
MERNHRAARINIRDFEPGRHYWQTWFDALRTTDSQLHAGGAAARMPALWQVMEIIVEV